MIAILFKMFDFTSQKCRVQWNSYWLSNENQ